MKKNAKKYIVKFVNELHIYPIADSVVNDGDGRELEDFELEELGFALNERSFTFVDKKQLLKNLSMIFGVSEGQFILDTSVDDGDGFVRVSFPCTSDGHPVETNVKDANFIADVHFWVHAIPSIEELENLID